MPFEIELSREGHNQRTVFGDHHCVFILSCEEFLVRHERPTIAGIENFARAGRKKRLNRNNLVFFEHTFVASIVISRYESRLFMESTANAMATDVSNDREIT